MRRRAWTAAGLWLLLAFLIWNVRFDHGVRTAASSYIDSRVKFLRGQGHRIEMASAMREGIRSSARAATIVSLPALAIAISVAAALAIPRRSAGLRK
jgi:hypothetical protein